MTQGAVFATSMGPVKTSKTSGKSWFDEKR